MSNKKILIVDDEMPILKMLKKASERQGYTVSTAETAEEALEILKTEKFKAMILDLFLPGMNGLDLCREIRKDEPDAFILAMTGYASKFELDDCLAAGFDGYFLKPLNLNNLYEVINEAFNP